MTQAKGNKPQNKNKAQTEGVAQVERQPRPALPALDLHASDAAIIENLTARVYGSKRSGYNQKVIALIQGFVPVIVVAGDFSEMAPAAYFEQNLGLEKLRGILSGSDANFSAVTANRLSALRRYLSSLQGYSPSAPLSEQTIGHHRLICSRLLSILHNSLPGERGRKSAARPERKPQRGNRRPFQKKEVAGTPKAFQVRPPRLVERLNSYDIFKVEKAPENGSKLPGAVYEVRSRTEADKVVLADAKTLKEARLFVDPTYGK